MLHVPVRGADPSLLGVKYARAVEVTSLLATL